MWPFILGIRTYTLLYAGSMLAMWAIACALCRPRRIPLRVAGVIGLCYFVGMTAGAKILFDVQQGSLNWLGYVTPGYYLQGGLWGGPLAHLAIVVPAVAVGRRDWRARLDLIAWSLPIPMMIAKLACFANGCCYGTPAAVPWAVSFPDAAGAAAGAARQPVQLYEVCVLLLILGSFLLLRRKSEDGTMLLWFVLIYGVGRPLTEFVRGDGPRVPDIGPLTASQAVCFGAASLAGGLLAARMLRGRGAGQPVGAPR